MDDILERLQKTLRGSYTQTELTHKDLYKNWGRYGNQEGRRAEILQQQKSKRENKLDDNRGILDLMELAQEEETTSNEHPKPKYRPNVFIPGFTNTPNHYSNVLMHSEWIVEKPEDFSTNWLVAPCPKGIRVLVVACRGKTRLYSKYGQLLLITKSFFPGGSRNEEFKECSVLDGFYCKDIETVFIIDVLSWKNHVMTDGELEFRYYWLIGKFMENPGLINVGTEKTEKYITYLTFKLLPMINCDVESLQKFMMTYPPLEMAKLDGFLFYHKHGQYIAGETPLVGWLYPYMVPEVLYPGMIIHKSYAAGKPKKYVNQAKFIQIFEEKMSKKRTPFTRGKKKNQSSSESSMDEDVPAVQNGNIAPMDTENTADGVNLQINNAQNGATEALNSEKGANVQTISDSLFCKDSSER